MAPGAVTYEGRASIACGPESGSPSLFCMEHANVEAHVEPAGARIELAPGIDATGSFGIRYRNYDLPTATGQGMGPTGAVGLRMYWRMFGETDSKNPDILAIEPRVFIGESWSLSGGESQPVAQCQVNIGYSLGGAVLVGLSINHPSCAWTEADPPTVLGVFVAAAEPIDMPSRAGAPAPVGLGHMLKRPAADVTLPSNYVPQFSAPVPLTRGDRVALDVLAYLRELEDPFCTNCQARVVDGSLPTGLAIAEGDKVIAGIPTVTGNFTAVLEVSGGLQQRASRMSVTFRVSAPGHAAAAATPPKPDPETHGGYKASVGARGGQLNIEGPEREMATAKVFLTPVGGVPVQVTFTLGAPASGKMTATIDLDGRFENGTVIVKNRDDDTVFQFTLRP